MKTNFGFTVDERGRRHIASGERLKFVADLISRKSKKRADALESAAKKASSN